MKIQDFAFLIVLAALILKRSSVLSAYAGIISLILSIPLFSFWIFFTAERFTWYATAFFLLSILFHLLEIKRSNE